MEKPEPSQMERRALARRKAPIKRIFAADILNEGGTEHCLVHIHDLSEGGMRVHTEYNFPAEETVSLRLHLDEPIEVQVKRVWEKPLVGGMNVYGLQFQPLVGPSLGQLRFFLDQHLRENRRKSFRLERILVVEMQVDNKSSRFGVFTLDLSASGMRINHEEPLPENCQLDFRILLEPGQPPVAVKSEVSWQKENAFGHYLIGLRFTEIDEAAEDRIESYITQALERSSHGSGGLSSFLPPA